MNKCLKITFNAAGLSLRFLRLFIQKHARTLRIEGTAQIIASQTAQVIACGSKDDVNLFVDEIYKGSSDCAPENIETEPFVKRKDYRGVFRIIGAE